MRKLESMVFIFMAEVILQEVLNPIKILFQSFLKNLI